MRRQRTAEHTVTLAGPAWILALGLALLGWTLRVMTYGPLEGIRLGLHVR